MGQDSKYQISLNIAKLRKTRNISREDLSLALGFDNSYISKLERQKINITIERLDKIANYFSVKTSELLK